MRVSYTTENFKKILKELPGIFYVALLDSYLIKVADLEEKGVKSGFVSHEEWIYLVLTGQGDSILVTDVGVR
ncbi:Uncharacterised protein [uncultured archaeon]|nr:Uncharacterised protein [uncultured archaeon]